MDGVVPSEVLASQVRIEVHDRPVRLSSRSVAPPSMRCTQ
jgi:hypothetical protein